MMILCKIENSVYNPRMRRFISLFLLFLLAGCQLNRSGNPAPTQAAVSAVPTVEAGTAEAVTTGGETAVFVPETGSTPTAIPIATPRAPYQTPENAGDWTVMLYVATDNELDEVAESLINQVEALPVADRVTILLQIDRRETAVWTEGRRYRIVADEDLAVVSSELLASLGEINMGDPRVLADFVAWGVERFPARQQALMLWGHGGGWRGLLMDETTALGTPDDLSLPDVIGGLNLAFDQSGLDRFDLLVLDAPLMNQLSVADGLSPLADFMLLPTGLGWLSQLAGQTAVSEIQSGTLLDLTAVSELSYSVELLAFGLSQVDAPLGALQPILLGLPNGGQIVRLGDATALFAEDDFPADVQTAALRVSEALKTAVLSEHVELPLTLTVSRNVAFAQATSLAEWAGWQQSRPILQADASLHSVWRQAVGLQNPAFFRYESVSAELMAVRLVVFEEGEDGRVLRQSQPLWRGVGVGEDEVIWTSELPVVENGIGDGAIVLGEQQPDGGWWVTGRVRRENTAVSQMARLRFDAAGVLQAVWTEGGEDSGLWRQSGLQEGDLFQVVEERWAADGSVTLQGGAEVVAAADGALLLTQRALPDGDYWVGIEDGAGQTTLTPLTVQNNALVPGFRTYLDPRYGFQFRYPADWAAPAISETLVVGGLGDTRLQIRTYPDLAASATLGQLRDETVATFGDIDILFEDSVTIGGVQGQQVAYGYETPQQGGRTGQFLLLINGQQGAVIDVDGAQADEAATIATVQEIGASWTFVPMVEEVGDWLEVNGSSWSVAYPSHFVLGEANGWQKFSSGSETFLALQERPFAGDVDALLAEVVADAGAGLDDFMAEPPRWQGIGARLWRRVDFGYGTTQGFIAVLPNGESGLVAWAEGSEEGFEEGETAVFLPMLASLE